MPFYCKSAVFMHRKLMRGTRSSNMPRQPHWLLGQDRDPASNLASSVQGSRLSPAIPSSSLPLRRVGVCRNWR